MPKYVKVVNNSPGSHHPLYRPGVTEGEKYGVIRTYNNGGCVILNDKKKPQHVTPKLWDDVMLVEV